MERKAVLLDLKDNVATCTGEVRTGDTVLAVGDEKVEVVAAEDIPIWHKIALRPIAKGEAVIKYGEMIGEADKDIKKGGWVSHENIHSVPRDYESEYILKD
ncbi:UxaA family hydrolase [Mitsuokella sp.]|uniref:UxaA family hydrolase n=1 Tax=unclassified Mitsuokella TaxID=2637239 RepID=UPI003D7DE2A7